MPLSAPLADLAQDSAKGAENSFAEFSAFLVAIFCMENGFLLTLFLFLSSLIGSY